MRCVECETIEDVIFETTTLWWHLPTPDIASRVLDVANKLSLITKQFAKTGVSVQVGRARLDDLLTSLFGELNTKELIESRVISTDGAEPTVAELGRIMSGDVFVNRFKSQWLIEAMREERYTTHYQPIVHAKGPRLGQTFAMEGLFRVRDSEDNIIPPGYVFKLAEDADLLFSLDLAARACAVNTAGAAGYDGRLFINFNPSSIYDPAYCLRTTAAGVAELGMKPGQVTFEVTETHQAQDMNHLKGILAFYRRAGFKVALDDVGAGWSGLNMLHELNPDFVKIDMDLVRNIQSDSLKQSIVRHLIAIADELDIELIAEGIETDAEADVLREMGAHYLQGYHFAKPGPL